MLRDIRIYHTVRIRSRAWNASKSLFLVDTLLVLKYYCNRLGFNSAAERTGKGTHEELPGTARQRVTV